MRMWKKDARSVLKLKEQNDIASHGVRSSAEFYIFPNISYYFLYFHEAPHNAKGL